MYGTLAATWYMHSALQFVYMHSALQCVAEARAIGRVHALGTRIEISWVGALHAGGDALVPAAIMRQ
jgi:hypothetical protein